VVFATFGKPRDSRKSDISTPREPKPIGDAERARMVTRGRETQRKLAEKRARQEEAQKARMLVEGIDIPW